MSIIADIFKQLNQQQRDEIYYAFDNNMPCCIEYEKGKYIGVNIEGLRYIVEEQRVGEWSVGTFVSKDKADVP